MAEEGNDITGAIEKYSEKLFLQNMKKYLDWEPGSPVPIQFKNISLNVSKKSAFDFFSEWKKGQDPFNRLLNSITGKLIESEKKEENKPQKPRIDYTHSPNGQFILQGKVKDLLWWYLQLLEEYKALSKPYPHSIYEILVKYFVRRNTKNKIIKLSAKSLEQTHKRIKKQLKNNEEISEYIEEMLEDVFNPTDVS